MKVKFQADADLDARVLRGLRRAAPEIDIRSAADARHALEYNLEESSERERVRVA